MVNQDEDYLSRKLCLLADRREQICIKLERAGLGFCSKVWRERYIAKAIDDNAKLALERYWTEYARERFAALRGPMDILKGDIPDRTTYHSSYLQKLRQDLASGLVQSVGAFKTPQIEPTIKLVLEACDDSELKQWAQRLFSERSRRAKDLRIEDVAEFESFEAARRYEMLWKQSSTFLSERGFVLQSPNKRSAVFRKLLHDGRWEFVAVDTSWDGICTGALSLDCALVIPGTVVKPGSLPLSAIATIPPGDVVPGFSSDLNFGKESFPEFCLAIKNSVTFTNVLFESIDELIGK